MLMVSLVSFAKKIFDGDTVSAATDVIYLNDLRIIQDFRKNLTEKTSFYTFYKGKGMGVYNTDCFCKYWITGILVISENSRMKYFPF